MSLQFQPFPSIEGFHNVVKSAAHFLEVDPPLEWPYKGYKGPLPRGTMTYRGKIKLHGTNAAVRINAAGEFAAQSRSRIITPEQDNDGFAKWAEAHKKSWETIGLYVMDDITFFGEWCGPGIMKGTAINQIPNRIFAIFSMLMADQLVTDPNMIKAVTGHLSEDMKVLPWYSSDFLVDFNHRENLEETARLLNMVVEMVEYCDPWVKETFGVEGVGEGVVYYPGAGESHPIDLFSNFAFKAKGEKHKVVKSKEAVQVDPNAVANVAAFVDMFVTEPRLEQGLAVVGEASLKKTGEFLKWIGQDVEKESRDELAASCLKWENVQKAVQIAARNWFIQKCKEI